MEDRYFAWLSAILKRMLRALAAKDNKRAVHQLAEMKRAEIQLERGYP